MSLIEHPSGYVKIYLLLFLLLILGLTFTTIYFTITKSPKITSPLVNNNSSNTTPGPQQSKPLKKTEAIFVSVGDIFLHDININAAYDVKTKMYDFNSVFSQVADYFNSADLATAWLGGGTYVDNGPFATYPLFKSPISLIAAMENTGFDAVFRTNHTMDFGVEGLNTTTSLLEKHNINQIAAADTEEKSKKIFIYQKNDLKIAYLGYIYGMNGLPIPKPWMINLIDLEKIKEDVNLAKKQADFVIVALHWGNEYQRQPSQPQKKQAQQIADFGADLIIASHPHVIQPVELINASDGRKVYVAYSLGNFYCGQRDRYTDTGVILKYIIKKTGEQTTLQKISYIPTYVAAYIENNKYQYKILPAKKYIDLFNQNQAPILTKTSYTRLKQAYEDTVSHLNKPDIGFIEVE